MSTTTSSSPYRKPYEHRLPYRKWLALEKRLRALAKDPRVFHAHVQATPLRHGQKLWLYIECSPPDKLWPGKGISEKQWVQFSGKVRSTLARSLPQAEVKCRPWRPDQKFWLGMTTYILTT
jgi:hypothetical protein